MLLPHIAGNSVISRINTQKLLQNEDVYKKCKQNMIDRFISFHSAPYLTTLPQNENCTASNSGFVL